MAASVWKAHVALLRQLTDLASVIVAPGRGEKVHIADGCGAIRAVIKSDGKQTFLFAASDARKETLRCTFVLPSGNNAAIGVYGEKRTVAAINGKLTDVFRPLDVHVYQLK